MILQLTLQPYSPYWNSNAATEPSEWSGNQEMPIKARKDLKGNSYLDINTLTDKPDIHFTFADSIIAWVIVLTVAPSAFAAANTTASRRTISAAAAGTSFATS